MRNILMILSLGTQCLCQEKKTCFINRLDLGIGFNPGLIIPLSTK